MIFDRLIAPNQTASPQVSERRIGYINVADVTRAEVQALDSVHAEHGDDEIVFVDIVELVEGPERLIASCIPVRLQSVENEGLRIGEGLTYRRLIQGSYEVFPRLMEREMPFPRFPALPPERSPQVIEGGAEIVDAIADNEGHGRAKRTEVGEIDHLRTVRLYANREFLGFSPVHFLVNGFELVDVAIGPFDL